MYRNTMNVEHEMNNYTGNKWSHRNCNKRFKENFGSHTRKIFNTFTTKDSYTRNTTVNTESTAVCNLKPKRWESPLVQENTRKKTPMTRDNNLIIIIIIIIIIQRQTTLRFCCNVEYQCYCSLDP